MPLASERRHCQPDMNDQQSDVRQRNAKRAWRATAPTTFSDMGAWHVTVVVDWNRARAKTRPPKRHWSVGESTNPVPVTVTVCPAQVDTGDTLHNAQMSNHDATFATKCTSIVSAAMRN